MAKVAQKVQRLGGEAPTISRPRAPDTGIVYTATNLVNGKVYVGSTIQKRARITQHKGALRKGVHGNEYFQRSWNKHGEQNFVWCIVEECFAADRLKREQWWIEHFKSDQVEFGYNLIPTRESQLYGAAMAVHQKAGWARLTAEERRAKNAHLQDPEIRAKADKRSGEARSTPEHKERQRKIAVTYLTTEANRSGNSERLFGRWKETEFREARLKGLARGRAKSNANPTPKMLAALTAGRMKAIAKIKAKAAARRAGKDIV